MPNPTFESKYIDCEPDALYPFGYGLSYASFEYSDGRISAEEIKKDGSVTVSCKVKNVGKYEGEEVVQLYIRDVVSSITRPVAELKGFEKIRLAPGEERRVSFTLGKEALAFWNSDMEYTVEPGLFKCRIAKDSRDPGVAFSFRVAE